MQVQPYLFFDGRCEEAIEFYRRALGAEVAMVMRFKDSPEPPQRVDIVIVERSGRFVEVNDAFSSMLGIPAPELRGVPTSVVTHPADRDGDRVTFERLYSGATGVSGARSATCAPTDRCSGRA